ncbi:MAG: DNA polymerase III subunit delta' [Bacteroidetes bacterium]|nr:MAG: DNA polymerase III subunit delta' [Bacteroidota bacterium]
MAWTDVLGQERVKQALQRAIASGRVAHAFLFHGPDGAGKRAMALAFARALQCERGGPEACGRCLACTKVSRMLHPDVHVLLPYPSDADEAEVARRLQRLGEQPYAAVDFMRRPSLEDASRTSNKQAFYSVARLNEEVRRAMSFKPLEGRYKIAILTDADVLRVEAANAFLKLLEEPSPQTVFILTTSRPDRLLPTIVSRCQRLRFDPLPAALIEAALVEREGVEPAAAATLARMADGSYTRALDLLENEDLLADRELVLDYFRFAYARSVTKQAALIERIGKLGRERVKGVLMLMLSWMRDLLLFRTMGNEAPLVNVDQRATIEQFCRNVPQADLSAMVEAVEEAIELVGRNVHVGLVLTVLAQALHRAMRGRAGVGLYVPLAEPAEAGWPAG